MRRTLTQLVERSNVVVLAQASMARLLGSLPQAPRVPVLTSPLSGLLAAGRALAEPAGATAAIGR